eukprot:Sspe_Gene.110804::Locus_91882_Transcript_1_1_Confidence_1.000_Length_831::g.110804::m.110804
MPRGDALYDSMVAQAAAIEHRGKAARGFEEVVESMGGRVALSPNNISTASTISPRPAPPGPAAAHDKLSTLQERVRLLTDSISRSLDDDSTRTPRLVSPPRRNDISSLQYSPSLPTQSVSAIALSPISTTPLKASGVRVSRSLTPSPTRSHSGDPEWPVNWGSPSRSRTPPHRRAPWIPPPGRSSPPRSRSPLDRYDLERETREFLRPAKGGTKGSVSKERPRHSYQYTPEVKTALREIRGRRGKRGKET